MYIHIYLIFVILITMCVGVFLFGLILYGTLCFLDLGDCFLSQVREFFSYYVFKYILRPFLFLFSFWDPYNESISALDVVPEVSNCPNFFSYIFKYMHFNWYWHNS